MSEKFLEQGHLESGPSETKIDLVLDDARQASNAEKEMGLWQALKLYPKAVAWSIGISAALIMEGYGIVLLGNFYAFPAFQQRYGVLIP
jgi:SP family general alpha glucoside:H+ symporter-like MFS transporter